MIAQRIRIHALPAVLHAPPRLRLVTGAKRRRPHLFVNPASDATFVARVEALVATGISDPDRLAEALRASYPEAVVRQREISGESDTWYVYRDGHWVAEDGSAG